MFIGRLGVEVGEDGKIHLPEEVAECFKMDGSLYIYSGFGVDMSDETFLVYSHNELDENDGKLIGSIIVTEENCLTIPSEYIKCFIGECCLIGMGKVAELHIAKNFDDHYGKDLSDDTDVMQIAEMLDF